MTPGVISVQCYAYFVSCKDSKGLHDLFGGVGVGGLACHEVKESVKGDVICVVRIHDGHDTLEVSLSLQTYTLHTLHTNQHLKA